MTQQISVFSFAVKWLAVKTPPKKTRLYRVVSQTLFQLQLFNLQICYSKQLRIMQVTCVTHVSFKRALLTTDYM